MVAQYLWILRKRAFILLILLRLPRALLAGIVATRDGSMSSGTQVTVFYDLAVRLKDDSDVSIGDGFRGYGEAQRAGETIARVHAHAVSGRAQRQQRLRRAQGGLPGEA